MPRKSSINITTNDWESRADEIAAKIIAGGIVLFPTETVYGLGALPNENGVQLLIDLKLRPKGKPFQLLISDLDKLGKYGVNPSPLAMKVMETFWPGPLTIVLDVTPGLFPFGLAPSGNVGFRMPAHGLCLDLVRRCGGALAASSANVTGNPEPRTCSEALRQFSGRLDASIDGGPTGDSLHSTVISVRNGDITVIRKGAVSEARLREVEESYQASKVSDNNNPNV
ncbi:MAG: L-threonylcarbamoyladenylate synthase [bacterium]